MGTQLEFHGGSVVAEISADHTLSRKRAWNHQINATSTGLEVFLPDATRMDMGYPVIQVVVATTSEDFDLVDDSGNVVISGASADDIYTFALLDNSTADGVWKAGTWALGSVGSPPSTIKPWHLGYNVDGRTPYKYDFAADTWSTSAVDSTAFMGGATGCRISGTGTYSQTNKDHERFNPESWSVLTDDPVARDEAQGARELTTSDDRKFVFGSSVLGDSQSTDSYDLSADAWSSHTNIPVRRHKGRIERNGTDFYSLGGSIGFGSTQTTDARNDAYDSVGDSWSVKTAMSLSRGVFASSVNHNGDFTVYGGRSAAQALGTTYDDVESYSPSGDAWTTLADAPTEVDSGSAVYIAANKRTYLHPGNAGTGTDADNKHFYQHVTLTDTYTQKLDVPLPSFTNVNGSTWASDALTD